MSLQSNGASESDSPIQTRQRIYLYVLRHTTTDEKFKIKAYFENDVKFTFTRLEPVDEKASSSPYIYRAELDLAIDSQRRLVFMDQQGSLPIRYYRLRLSRKIFSMDTTYRDYNDEKERVIDNPCAVSYYFLFDVDFARNRLDSPPGKHEFPGFLLNPSPSRLQRSILESTVFVYILPSSRKDARCFRFIDQSISTSGGTNESKNASRRIQ